jgi:hypothetical protein
MTARVPHSSWYRCALVLIAGALMCAGAARAANSPQPSGKPLWNAYPLDSGSSKPAAAAQPATPIGPRPQTASAPELQTRGGGAQMALQIAFFGCLGALFLIGATAAAMRVARRRRTEVTCEISWSPSAEGGAFRATALEQGDTPHMVAASPPFEHGHPGAPDDDDAAPRKAYTELVVKLLAEGWEPYERGTAWWEMRLRRNAGSSMPREAIHG